jgi:hypothetical protein
MICVGCTANRMGSLCSLSVTAVSVISVISVTDDLSGISSCSAYVSPPPGSQDSSRSCSTQSFVVNEMLAGNVTCVFSIPRYASTGAWTLNYVQCFDHRGSVGYAYFPADLNGPATSFTQVGRPDVRGPSITFFSLSPSTISTLDTSASINIVVRASDDVSGISWCYVMFSGPFSTSFDQTIYPTISNQLNATATGFLPVSRFSPMGTYALQTLQCRDVSGKSTTLGPAQFLSSLGNVSFSFRQVSPGDVTLPSVSGLRMAPPEIDTSLSNQFVNISLDLSDDMSGISYCSVWVQSLITGSSVGCTTATFQAYQLMNGTAVCRLNVPRFAAVGIWTWSSLTCFDVANRPLSLSSSSLAAVSGTATVFTQTGRADALPPVIHAVMFAPTVINTSLSSAIVNVTFWASDDAAGVQSCRVNLLFPGATPATRTFTFSTYTAINSSYGVVSGSISVASGSALGVYNITLARCSDATGKSFTYSGDTLAPIISSTVAFTQVSMGDLLPPVISSVRFSPTVVNTSIASAAINASVAVSDDFIGIRSCFVSLLSPSGTVSRSCNTPTLSQGQLLNGVVSCVLTLPVFSEFGNWSFNSVQCTDVLSQSTSFSLGDPQLLAIASSSQLGVSQVAQGDLLPPSVTAVMFTPSVIDTSLQAATVNISLVVQDDASGISSCSLMLRSPDGSSSFNVWNFAPTGVVSGALSTLYTFPTLSARGLYTVISLDCTDRAGRSQSFSASSFTSTFGSIAINQTGVGDTAPVTVHSVLFSPSDVNCNNGPETVITTLNVSDDLSGVSYCQVWLQDPRGNSQSCRTATLPSGTRSAILTCSFVLAQFAPQGLWLISSVDCWDTFGRYQGQSRSTLTANRVLFNAINQSGVGDTSGPQVLNLSVTPIAPTVDMHANDSLVTVDSAAGTILLNFTWHFSDDVSGVTSCSVRLLTPSGSSSTLNTPTFTARRNGTAWAQFTLPQFAEPGLYNASQISCRDALANSGILAGSVGRTLFAVMGSQDVFGPQIISVSPSTINITTTSSSVSFLLFLNVTDDLSGISSCDMTFRSRVSPSTASASCSFLRLTSTRVPNNGNQTVVANVTVSCSFASNSLPGVWNCTWLRCIDARSRSTLLTSPEAFAAAGLVVPLVNQLGRADLVRPNITFVTLSTRAINTTGACV